MDNAARINLLADIARSPSPAHAADHPRSILSLAAASYAARPSGDATVPTGFDPIAIALFEAIVEGAFLVANADGVFDLGERKAFERVVVAVCGGSVASRQIELLISDLSEQFREQGLDERIRSIARAVTRKEHGREVLRIAALLAQATGDVSEVERAVLVRLAAALGLDEIAVDHAVADVRRTLAAAGSA